MAEPSGGEDEHRNILTAGWDIRQGKTYRRPNSVVQEHVTTAIGGQMALRWEAIESPVITLWIRVLGGIQASSERKVPDREIV
jgi:hypothetical protein